MNWINDIVQVHSETEAPSRFYYWAAVTAMSAVIKKNIWMERHIYRLYPNIYTFIIAKSGMKKGVPIRVCRQLVEKSGEARVITGRTSVPKMLQELGKLRSPEPKPSINTASATINVNGTGSKKAQALIISGELASFLVKDTDGLHILTDLYNTHEHEEKWENALKGTGIDVLVEPCLSIIGATNDDHFAETIPQSDVKGGFIARTFIVYSDDKPTPNSLVSPPKKLVNLDQFVPFLQDLAKLRGEFHWTKETGEWYDDWYNDFMPSAPDEKTGVYNRIGDSIIKLAILLSLARNGLQLEMDLDALQEAKAEAMNCALGTKRMSMGGGSSVVAQTKLVISSLLSHPDHRLSRSQILRKYWGDIDPMSLDIVIETLLQAGMISLTRGQDQFITMKDDVVRDYLDYVRKSSN